MLNKLKNITSVNVIKFIYHNFLIILGSFILGFGTAIFLTKNLIVAGGLSGIAFIIQFFVGGTQIIDIVVWVATIILWVISFFILGKQFALRTLLASIIFPLSLTLCYRVPGFEKFVDYVSGSGTTGDLLLCSIFGGITIGAGVSLTFLGKGSTGGVDVISFILNKYFGIKVSIAGLLIDGTIIISALIAFGISEPSYIPNCLVGIISAVVTSLIIELMYSRKQNAFILEVISERYEDIANYIMNEMERGVTLIEIKGAYTNINRTMIRSIMSKSEYLEIKDYIAKIDPNAFLTFTDTNAVYGNGFKENFGVSNFVRKKIKK